MAIPGEANILAQMLAMQQLAQQGQKGDSMMANLSPQEAQQLKDQGGAGTTNPATGLPQFFDGSSDFAPPNSPPPDQLAGLSGMAGSALPNSPSPDALATLRSIGMNPAPNPFAMLTRPGMGDNTHRLARIGQLLQMLNGVPQ